MATLIFAKYSDVDRDARPHVAVSAAGGAAGAPTTEPSRRLFMRFVLFVLLGQAFMSFDGGATSMSAEMLLEDGWTLADLGWLASMDKWGQVVCCFLWMYVLDCCDNIKVVLSAGVFVKALCCYGFGALQDKTSMMVVKFGMGASEALVGAWGMNWIGQYAPRPAEWFALQGLSAAVGSGIGMLATIVGDEFNQGYGFAFECQAVVLALLFVAMIATKSKDLKVKNVSTASPPPTPFSIGAASNINLMVPMGVTMVLPSDLPEVMSPSLPDSLQPLLPDEGRRPPLGNQSFCQKLKELLSRKIWMGVVLASSLVNYVTAGLVLQWQPAMVNIWGFTDTQATVCCLLVMAVGGAIGANVGSGFFDGLMQQRPTQNTMILTWCLRFVVEAALWGTLGSMLFAWKGWYILHIELPQQAWGWLLCVVLTSFAIIFVLLNSLLGILEAMMKKAADPHETIAFSLLMAAQNVVGYAGGMILTSGVADTWGDWILWQWPGEEDALVVSAARSTAGMIAALMPLWLLALCLRITRGFVEGNRGEMMSGGN